MSSSPLPVMDTIEGPAGDTGHLAVAILMGIFRPVSLILSYLWAFTASTGRFWLVFFKILATPFTFAASVLAVILSPVIYLSAFLTAPVFWAVALIPKLEPLYIFFSIAAIVGILTGLISYLTILLFSSTLLSAEQIKKDQMMKTTEYPYYHNNTEDENNNNNPFQSLNTSRRSSFTDYDFDTDDAKALQTSTGRQGGRGDLYSAWRERVGSGRGSGSGSDAAALRSPPAGSSSGGGGGGGGGPKKRLPGLLFGTTIHEEDDDSL